MENLITYGTYLFGFIVVFGYSIKEFNAPKYRYDNNVDISDAELCVKSKYARLATPTLPKYMTDTAHYNTFKRIFALSAIVLYFLFTQLLLMVPGIDVIIGEGDSREALAAIISLLLFIGIVKSDDITVKNIQLFTKWPKVILFGLIKDWLHSFACIPGLGCDVFDVLCYKDIDVDSDKVKPKLNDIMNKVYRNDFEVKQYIEFNDFKNLGNPDSMILRWARLSYLINRLDEWNNDPKFKNQIQERSLGWLALREAYINLIEHIVNFRDKDQDMSQDEEDELSKQLDHLLARSYRLISCVVIMTAKPSEDPLSYLRELGFKVSIEEQMFSRGGEIFRVLFALVPAVAIIALAYTLFEPTGGNTANTLKNMIVYVESSFAIMVLPLILVFALKRQMIKSHIWEAVTLENKKSFFELPLKIYMMLSLISWGMSLVLMMILQNKNGVISNQVAEWKSMGIFCFISAITAFITCYRTDVPRKIYHSRVVFLLGISRIPFIHGILTALTVWVGLHLAPTSVPETELYKFWQYPLLGFSLSMVIGYTLFYGKHSIEQRKISNRDKCNEQVIIVQGNSQYPAMMLNKSSTGVMLMLEQARSLLQDNKSIEIVFNSGLKKIGSIVKIDTMRVNVSYNS